MTSTVILKQIQARQSLDPFLSNFPMAERVTEFKDDPLVLSCAVKRYLKNKLEYKSMGEVLEYVNSDDRELAEQIRKYYGKKFFWDALSNTKPLSDYRRRLINLLENRISKCTDRDCGIYYKLPWFYDEDMIYEDLKKKYSTEKLKTLEYNRSSTIAIRLTYICHSLSTQNKRKIKYFWFHDSNNNLYSINVNTDNELLTMFETIINSTNDHIFETKLTEDRIDKMHFYKLFSFKFLKG
jgi:hypothetical protein